MLAINSSLKPRAVIQISQIFCTAVTCHGVNVNTEPTVKYQWTWLQWRFFLKRNVQHRLPALSYTVQASASQREGFYHLSSGVCTWIKKEWVHGWPSFVAVSTSCVPFAKFSLETTTGNTLRCHNVGMDAIVSSMACCDVDLQNRSRSSVGTGAGTYSADTTKAVPLFQVVRLSM